MFELSEQDRPYETTATLAISLICRMDSYKFSHHLAYPSGVTGMSSYGCARVESSTKIVPFGMQMLCQKYLTQQVTMQDVDAAEAFAIAHFGRPLFARVAWTRVVTQYGGRLPLIIRSVPEGLVVRGGMPIYTVTCLDPELFWMSAAFETLVQRGVWYPTTIATQDYETKNILRKFYEKTGAPMEGLPFALHDFGARGVSSGETAEIGGAAHLVNFMGSDTVEGVLAANHYYDEPMSGFSVYATEHSVQCSFGSSAEGATEYIRHQLRRAKELGVSIFAMVLDGYDIFREVEICCTRLRDEIKGCGAKVVFRPDSGDALDVVPRILLMQDLAFGHTVTDLGYKRINNVGVIQGDGVNQVLIEQLMQKITDMGYAADCVTFGSGGALLQKVNRDTFRFAQKASAIRVNGEWRGISKNPVTDTGKSSDEGVLTLRRVRMTGELVKGRMDREYLHSEYDDVMQVVYHSGTLYNRTTLADIRKRVG